MRTPLFPDRLKVCYMSPAPLDSKGRFPMARLTVITLWIWITLSRANAAGWLETYTAIASQPGQEATAFAYLQHLPLENKTTVEFHVAMARAARAVRHPLWASRAIMVIELFLKPSPLPDLKDVKAWLGERALEYHRRALDYLAKGDEWNAANEYLAGVRCDQALLGFDERHLRDCSYQVMDKLVRSHSGDPGYWGHLAFYSYYFGHLEAAKNAIEHGLALQKDPYLVWILQYGLKTVQAELDKKAAQPSAAIATSTRSTREVDPAVIQYTEARRAQILNQLAQVNQILARDDDLSPVAVDNATRRGPVLDPKHPHPIKEAVANYKRIRDQLSSDLRSLVRSSAGFRSY
jgi:tetratricopeptide (TPR) repeat protein